MTSEELTWPQLMDLEPRLKALWDQALEIEAPSTIKTDDPWFEPKGLNAQLINLVGPLAPDEANPLLKTVEAYKIALREILKAFIKAPPRLGIWFLMTLEGIPPG